MLGRNAGLILACLWAAGAVAAVAASDSVAIRGLACVPLALYWPGYAFLRAIGQEASSVEWHALAAMWSVASLILGGLLLNSVHLLMPLGWAAWLAAVVAVSSIVAVARRPRDRALLPSRHPLRAVSLGQGVVFAAAVLVAGAAFKFAIWDNQSFRQFQYTSFWMLPDDDMRPSAVTIGAKNAEERPMQYDIEVTQDGRILAVWRSLALEPGESLTKELTVALPSHESSRIEARLFETDSRDRIYRKVWIEAGGG